VYLIFWLLHLPESLCKDDVRCAACVNQNIVDQKSLDDTRYNHGIIVRIIFELKIFLGEGNWNVRPLGFDEESLHPNMMYSSLCFLLLLLVGWFRA
jgi:predicted  nucleic acid-binding Zn ribbon protein